ncbi:MAG TPA: hypothetical protein PK357_00660 [Candidatus Pacearchaeota archaeon]|nr:hypothetical protein [Candidatus Pacearchaeota archaeon]
MVIRLLGIEGKLTSLTHCYKNGNLESSEINIKVKKEGIKDKNYEYSTYFYGFIPKEFLHRDVCLIQKERGEDKKRLAQVIYLIRNPRYKISSIVENIPD